MLTTEQIRELIRKGEAWKFYRDWSWRKLSEQVRREQNNECYYCKLRGKYSPAKLVHHIMPLKKFPQYAYSRTWTDANGTEYRNLVAVCFTCHEQIEGRSFGSARKHFTNIERW